MNQSKRYLKVNLSAIAEAMELHSIIMEVRSYLDLETGEVIMITEEDMMQFDEISEQYADPETCEIDWAAVLPRLDVSEAEKETLIKVAEVGDGSNPRYLLIPTRSSREGYQDMADFIPTLSNARLQVRLERAIHGKGAFRAFKDALIDHPEERARWFKFKELRERERVLDWLASQDIEPAV